MNRRYPAECPVFEYEGKHYEGAMHLSWNYYIYTGVIALYAGEYSFTVQGERVKPLTRAAREMLEVCCG